MNQLYLGLPSDLNVGNGKSVSVVGAVVDTWIMDESKTIFSNIVLKEVPFEKFTPDNLHEVLETQDAIVILDELHAIVHKNHKIGERCTKHGEHIGLCYKLSEFFRQVRKRGIETYSTCQTFRDAHFQYRTLMQQQIECEKFNFHDNMLSKCNQDKCPGDHRHYIKQKLYRNGTFVKELPLFDPEPYYGLYDSFEIVEGWVNYE